MRDKANSRHIIISYFDGNRKMLKSYTNFTFIVKHAISNKTLDTARASFYWISLYFFNSHKLNTNA